MTERDREEALNRFSQMFDEASDETALIERLGTPTMAAISVLRGYVPSKEPEKVEEPAAPEPETAPDSSPSEPEKAPDAVSDEPAPEVPEKREVVEYFRDTPRPDPAAAEPEEIGSEPDLAVAPQGEDFPEALPESEPVFALPQAPAPKLIGWRLALYVLFGVVICVPVTIILIAIALTILDIGAGLTIVGIFTISLGFVGITVFADVMLLIGAGLAITAFGLPIIFCAVWFFIRAVAGFVNLVLQKGRSWCYAQTEEVSAE